MDTLDKNVETLIEGARLHGENSDPDHEVGDLQDLLRECWKLMAPSQRYLVLCSAAGATCINETGD